MDFAVGPITITSEREAVIDFTKSYMEDGVGIVFRKLTKNQKSSFEIFRPLKPQVWGCIVVTVLIVGALLFVIFLSGPYKETDGTGHFTISGSLWLVYGAFLQQGKTFSFSVMNLHP